MLQFGGYLSCRYQPQVNLSANNIAYKGVNAKVKRFLTLVGESVAPKAYASVVA